MSANIERNINKNWNNAVRSSKIVEYHSLFFYTIFSEMGECCRIIDCRKDQEFPMKRDLSEAVLKVHFLSQSPKHQINHCYVNHGLTCFGQTFVVPTVSSAVKQPSKSSLYYPTFSNYLTAIFQCNDYLIITS